MTEKVFKTLIAQLEEAVYYRHIHKNGIWEQTLERSRESLLNAFRKYYNEGYEQGKFEGEFKSVHGKHEEVK